MDERVVRNPAEMAEAVAAFLETLPAELGRRATVLVPREAVAHELRRQIIARDGGAALLAGVVFTRPLALANELCMRAGRPASAGLEQSWAPLLEQHISDRHPALDELRYYRAEHLAQHPGYPQALAQSLRVLDAAGLEAGDLEELARELSGRATERIGDLARLRRLLDETRAPGAALMSSAALLRRAAAILQDEGAQGLGPFLLVRVLDAPPGQAVLEEALNCPRIVLRRSLAELELPPFEISLHEAALDELEAACIWAERQIIEEDRPLGELAFACAQDDMKLPLARLLVRRLELPCPPAQLLLEGLPMRATAPGSALLAALDVVLTGMPRQALADCLHNLAPEESRACILAGLSRAGELGGRPESWRAWSRARRRMPGKAEKVLDAMVKLGRRCSTGGTIETMQQEIEPLLEACVPEVDERNKQVDSIRQGLEESARILQDAGLELRGKQLLKHLRQGLSDIHIYQARFGGPWPLVANPKTFAGLQVQAMRLVGLAEGSIPQSTGEDPVLPDFLRAQILCLRKVDLPLRLAEQERERLLTECALAGAAEALAASASLQQLDGQQLEPGTFLLELAGRAQHPPVGMISSEDLSAAAQNSRKQAGDWLRRHPRSSGQSALPERAPKWLKTGSMLGQGAFRRPGLEPAQGLAVTQLPELLACPLRFALSRLASLEEAPRFPSPWSLEPARFGSALHAAAESLFRAGAETILRKGDPDALRLQVQAVSEEALVATERELVLEGPEVRARVRKDLEDMLQALVDHYSRSGLASLVDAERWLAQPSAPCSTEAGTLHLRGKMDLVFTGTDGSWVIHDIKSGRPRLFDPAQGFELERDLQVLSYAACLQDAGQAVAEVALIFPSAGARAELRAHRGENLRRGLAWCRNLLAVCRRLLEEAAFAPLPDDEDRCKGCPFSAACDPAWRQQAALQVEEASTKAWQTLRQLQALRAPEEEA